MEELNKNPEIKVNVFTASLYTFLKTSAATYIAFAVLLVIFNDIGDFRNSEAVFLAFFLAFIFYPLAVLFYVAAFLVPAYYILAGKIEELSWQGFAKKVLPFSTLFTSLMVFLAMLTAGSRNMFEGALVFNLINLYFLSYFGLVFFAKLVRPTNGLENRSETKDISA